MIIELGALEIDRALGVNDDLHAVEFIDLIVLSDLFIEVNRVAQARAAPSFDAKTEPAFREALDVDRAVSLLSAPPRSV